MNYQKISLQTLRQDILYALRQMRLSPVFSVTAILTLALGIGATTAVFSLIDSVMLQSLPVVDPSTLYRIGNGNDCCDDGPPQNNWGIYSYPLFLRLKAAAPEFEQVAAFEAGRSTFSVRRGVADREPKPLTSEYVTGNYFETFGIGAFAGRTLSPSDDQPNSPSVAVLSYRVWQQQYGSDLSVVGCTFIVQGHPFNIVGIAPPGFFGEELSSMPPDLWLPIQQKRVITGKTTVLTDPAYMAWLRVIGRLKPHASIDNLPARLTGVLRQWLQYESEWPPAYLPQLPRLLPHQHIKVVPAGSGVSTMKDEYASSLRILLAVCCLVLLIACANIANLLLVRANARRAPTSLRMALGASRGRLIRQSLTESLVISLSGGIAGIAIAFLGVKGMIALAFSNAPSVPISALPSLPVLGFAFGLSLTTAVVFGTIPAWLASGVQPLEALRGVNRSTRDTSSLPQKSFVIVQATLSIVLLFGAGLLTRSLLKLQHQDFGYETDGRISIHLSGPLTKYSPEKLDALYKDLQYRLSHIPGVKSAALGQSTPFIGGAAQYIIREGQKAPDVNSGAFSYIDTVTPGYLETMGQHILRGRNLREDDIGYTTNAAVVDEDFVHRFFKPGEEPLGAHFGVFEPENSSSYEIVGIVNNVNYFDTTGNEHVPIFFASLAQHVHYNGDSAGIDRENHIIESAVVQIRGGQERVESQIRHIFSDVDPDLTILKIQPMQDQVDANFAQPRLVAQMTGLFGILALFLASIGLYGVTAYTVARRTSEFGVRLALGSSRSEVVKLVLGGAFLQILIGLIIGIPVSMICGRFIAAHLYQVKIWDPFVLVGSVVTLGIFALVASLIPAIKAASINPATALRTE